jgi:DNA repair exonuclease SbcCD ATPase subunit
LEDYDTYKDLDTKIKEVLKEKTFIEKNSGSIGSVQKELEYLDQEIFKLTSGIEQLKLDNQFLERRNENLSELLEDYIMYKEYQESIQSQTIEATDLLKDLDKMEKIETHVGELVDSRRTQLGRQLQTDRDIQRIETDINNIRFRLMEFNNLNEEKAQLEDKFDDIDVIKEALSSNKGIPLLFIQLYLRNTRMMVNQLLDTVYNGDLEVQEFIINDKEFRIPYIKNGLLIDDVVKCSLGEESFVSMALSFALIEQSVKDYNVMLLDEIDATLDTKKREQFLTILETQLDSIDAEQVFLITHNNMFDNYPVDIIMTSDKPIDNYKNTNVIFKA